MSARGVIAGRAASYCEVAVPHMAYRDGTVRTYARAPGSCMLGNMQSEIDHYEVLQIGRNAISRPFIGCTGSWLARFHPDNRGPGIPKTFLLLKRAYEVLSDPGLRTKYDCETPGEDEGPLPIFELQSLSMVSRGNEPPPWASWRCSTIAGARTRQPGSPCWTWKENGVSAGAPELRSVVPQGQGIT